MGKVTNEFNRAADVRRMRDGDKGRQGGTAGANNKIADPKGYQELDQAARGKQLHHEAVAPKKDNGPEPGW